MGAAVKRIRSRTSRTTELEVGLFVITGPPTHAGGACAPASTMASTPRLVSRPLCRFCCLACYCCWPLLLSRDEPREHACACPTPSKCKPMQHVAFPPSCKPFPHPGGMVPCRSDSQGMQLLTSWDRLKNGTFLRRTGCLCVSRGRAPCSSRNPAERPRSLCRLWAALLPQAAFWGGWQQKRDHH